jgi:hypothetical protein
VPSPVRWLDSVHDAIRYPEATASPRVSIADAAMSHFQCQRDRETLTIDLVGSDLEPAIAKRPIAVVTMSSGHRV